jgi:sugar lactone lactonase YvrE
MIHHPIARHHVDCLVDCADRVGEGAFWSVEDQAVYWLDVPKPSRIHRLFPATGAHDIWPMPEMVTAMARRADGTLLVASQSGINIFDPASGEFQRILDLEPDRPDNRSNDGAPDARGRFWIGTMQNNLADDGSGIPIAGSVGSLWRIEPGKPPFRAIEGMGITNGVAWSPDSRQLYVVDSMVDRIYVCDFDLDAGTVGARRIFSDVDELGTPDGQTIDAEGYLWSARWEGNGLVRFAPDGSVDRVVPVPAPRVTSCAFGGPELDTLYVTTARLGADAESLARYPQQGGLFAFKPGVRGLSRPLYAG